MFLMITLPVSPFLTIFQDLRLPQGGGIFITYFNAFFVLNAWLGVEQHLLLPCLETLIARYC